MIKHSADSYALYCKVWASVYRKHAKSQIRNMFSCYVREGIHEYVESYDRAEFLASSAREGLCGAYIAKALLAQGMSADDILYCNNIMQGYVDAADCGGLSVVEVMERVLETYTHVIEFTNRNNGIRYAWALMGAPELLDEAEEYDE